ncbi:DUF2066 domain-containing protein [Colwellia sp. 1_MG-2023]|uniref:DUF2066 domain-containing protein n=1 Tax=Colwellia sp. 1_MG-2023 TaxID=3062649 RepID=UPI0026E3714E|nr:DUF2066 domain-containing protein [Colwellia sp. 1_MG-2023]MDO6446183.1 DUF2066 domain-containing protein [Colwellia sp. 1_MG-2023]
MKNLSLKKMIRYWFVFTTVFISLSICISTNAVEVKDLYVAKVAVKSQGKNERNRALKQTLRAVLIKVGGHQSVLNHQAIKAQLNRYNSFVTHYRYERDEKQQFLQASFDEAKINQLFVDANLPIWGSLRPQVVLWLVDENGLLRNVISESHSSPLIETVNNFSSLRGLPIALPLWDLADTNNISTSDVWGRFSQPIFHASKRYQAEAIIVVRISDNSLLSDEQLGSNADGCELLCQTPIGLDWSYLSADDVDQTPQFSQRYQGFDRSELLSQALSDITDNIYQRYALTTGENNQYEIEVANIDSLARFVQVSQFLQELSSVQAVRLTQANGEVRRFSLTLIGSEHTFLASLKLHKALKQHIDILNPVIDEKVPVFYWERM